MSIVFIRIFFCLSDVFSDKLLTIKHTKFTLFYFRNKLLTVFCFLWISSTIWIIDFCSKFDSCQLDWVLTEAILILKLGGGKFKKSLTYRSAFIFAIREQKILIQILFIYLRTYVQVSDRFVDSISLIFTNWTIILFFPLFIGAIFNMSFNLVNVSFNVQNGQK